MEGREGLGGQGGRSTSSLFYSLIHVLTFGFSLRCSPLSPRTKATSLFEGRCTDTCLRGLRSDEDGR